MTKAVMVQAAIAIADQVGTCRAERLLRREALPEAVIARVLAGEAQRRRNLRNASPAKENTPAPKINDN
ncbi:hypothetical protein [Massilia sp. METH4]|uniref:hypothetical protein n=1 Tax=Massilia sp. METH4 TaxID=3123041 RepID=UPI0030CF426E